MIDKDMFATEWGLWCRRFPNAPDSEPIMRRYYQILTVELETEEFLRGSVMVFRKQQFFPSPQDVIDAALGSDAERLGLEWFTVRQWIKGNAVWDELSPQTQTAVRALGESRLRDMNSREERQLEQEFRRIWLDGPGSIRRLGTSEFQLIGEAVP